MGWQTVVKKGVETARSITDSLQKAVTHTAWTGQDGFGKPTYATGVSRKALVESKQQLVRDAQGREVLATTKLTFLLPISANGAATRREPIDPRDTFTLPDGTVAKVQAIEGLVNPDTSRPYLLEVWCG